MSAAASPAVLLERRDRVALLTLNRPEVVNAFNEEVRGALPELLAEVEADRSFGAVVIAGAGPRSFCADADIKEARAVGTPIAERARLMPSTWIEAVDRVTKPVIAAVHGMCLGGGWSSRSPATSG